MIEVEYRRATLDGDALVFAVRDGNLSTVGFLLGAAGFAGGAVLWITANNESVGGSGARLGFGPGSVAFSRNF